MKTLQKKIPWINNWYDVCKFWLYRLSYHPSWPTLTSHWVPLFLYRALTQIPPTAGGPSTIAWISWRSVPPTSPSPLSPTAGSVWMKRKPWMLWSTRCSLFSQATCHIQVLSQQIRMHVKLLMVNNWFACFDELNIHRYAFMPVQ